MTTMMKAPKFSMDLLQDLKSLVRLDFARAMRQNLINLRNRPDEHVATSTTKMLKLTDYLMDVEQPLIISMAMMEVHGAAEAWMPLSEERFSFYERIVNQDLTPSDFPEANEDLVAGMVTDFRARQLVLREVFKNADSMSPEGMRSIGGKKQTSDDKALMN